ncbi:RlpA-like double-psi beta-barrel-protein domain-containing protein-containing protein [Trametes punicea]|nr:RlpA-like double-psi beta-barrel-protein domain-containing protein-containing protein [Trametes punicea]
MHFLSFASLALAVSGASAIAIPRGHAHAARLSIPSTYAEGYLEDYFVYHTRYLQLDCESKHNTTFFDLCCHPMLATETLEKNRAPECNPANHVSSAVPSVTASATTSSANPTASQNLSSSGDDDDDCGDDDDEPTSAASAATPTATSGDDEDDCGDEDDEPSTSVAHTTSHVSSTQAPAATSSVEHVVSSSTHSTTPTHTATPTHTTTTPTKSSASPTESATPTGTSDKGPFTGNATFFYQGGQAGACGKVNPDSALIAAMQTKRYGDLSKESPLCGQQVKITNLNNGKTVTVTIADACPTCPGENDIDLSEGAFTQIATIPEGEVPISWEFV